MLIDDALSELSWFSFCYMEHYKVEEDYSRYLKREERLISLAREKKWQEKPVLMYLPVAKAAAGIGMHNLASLIGSKLLNSCNINISEDKFDISEVTKYIRPDIIAAYSFRVPTDSESAMYCIKNKNAAPEKMLAFEDTKGRTWLMNMTSRTRKSQVYKGWRWKDEKECAYFHDAALFFGWLAVISEVCNYVSSLSETWDDSIYLMLEKNERESVSWSLEGRVSQQFAEWLIGQYGVEEDKLDISGDIVIRNALYFPLFLLYSHDWRALGTCVYGDHIAEAFCKLRLMEEQSKRQYDEARRLASDYAKVYQTKKNIPDKTVKAMSESALNDWFGYVEFDEDVDLERVHEFEEDFTALQTILHQPCMSEYQIRLRKLGRHHAAGLYFPTLKCLCVDLRTLWSTAHEYFHLLDYHYGSLSQKASFEPVYNRYSYVLNGNAENIKKVCGSSKYGLDYYLMPTEVFARCAEMYLVRVLKVENSLVKPDDTKSFAYPDDEVLMEDIEEYFGDVFLVKYCSQEDGYGI